MHLLVAWLAIQLAWFGAPGESADQSGRDGHPRRLAVRQPAAVDRRRRDDRAGRLAGRRGAPLAQRLVGVGKARTKALRKSGNALIKAAIYIALAVLAIRFATGDGQSSSSSQQETTAGVFGWPGGQWIVGAAGLVLIGVGAWHIRKGLNKHFLKQIDTSDASPKALRLVTRLGQIGFPGKGIALIGVGALLV